jgi:hypothetical protein
MSQTRWGDHSGQQYSMMDLTKDLNSSIIVALSRDMNVRKIQPAFLAAAADFKTIW